jgi:hypothetical protein
MILLDTNVISALMLESPPDAVLSWFGTQPSATLWTSAITVMEIGYGLRLMPDGGRRARLETRYGLMMERAFADRVAAFGPQAASAAAQLQAERRLAGRPIASQDAMIAGIAMAERASIATRNTRDFEGCGVELINPFTDMTGDPSP